MKLHLPVSLRRVLLAVVAVGWACSPNAQAAVLHNSVSLQTYTDFGGNMGRYSVYEVNDLLRHLNENGVSISYTTGQEDYTISQGMISFESVVSGGFYTAIAPNFAVSVQHNGVPNPVFTDRYLPANSSIRYSGIEYRSSANNQFLLTPTADYKATRMSKLITDITPSELYNTPEHLTDGSQIHGVLQYRVGGGDMQQADAEGNTTWLKDAYNYITGGIAACDLLYSQVKDGTTDNRGMTDDSYTIRLLSTADYGPEGAGTTDYPLPFVTQPGDSGSPVWVWNEESESYQLISCHFGRIDKTAFSGGAPTWTLETMESFNKHVDMEAAGHAVRLGAVQETSESATYSDATNGVSTTTKFGSVTSAAALGFNAVSFCGVQNGVNTWLNLNSLKDTDNWYAYDGSYLNATQKNDDGSRSMVYADLFMTENLVFESAAGQNSIVLDADADLGIGSAEFVRTGNSGTAVFTVSSEANSLGRDYMLNSAGYNVGAGTEVHLQLANTQRDGATPYVREWRKVGAGDLYLEGTGDNEIFLNVGGKGTTYLREQDGYAAYNVLINNGATVNLGGEVGQVKRDVTFGNGGGVLDLAGDVQMDWNAAASSGGFTIHALTQDGIIANTAAGTTAQLRYTAAGDTTFLGSFADANGASLHITYDGGEGSSLLLHSIHTKLTGEHSGLTVHSGHVTLAGTITEHAQGSATGQNQLRYVNENDWHYADAAMNVAVEAGATFTLGSHARLQGDVNVANGGTFVLQEGVNHRYEYIEGWYRAEDTYAIADYYGLHGDVNLERGAEMQVVFSEQTNANTTLTGSIKGEGGMRVNTAQGTLTLAGTNTFSGAKNIERGTLIATGTTALGNTTDEKWNIGAQGVLAVNNTSAAEAVQHVSTASEGVLALTQDETEALDLNASGHNGLIIGAAEGTTIQYGTEGTGKELAATDGKWTLGGGGGELVVNFKLNGADNQLVLGNEYTKGIVTLTNTQNRIGSIKFTGGVTLDYTSLAALGGGHVALDYTNRLMGRAGAMDTIDTAATGVLLLDRMGLADVNLTKHTSLALGSEGNAVYNGQVILAADAAYRFGGSTGTLTLTQALTGDHDLVVDGQTYSGGVTNLATAATLTGKVTVMGYDAEQTDDHTGDATLRLSVGNALGNASSVTLKDGGILDINGTQQQLRHLSMEVGSVLTDSSANGSGVAELVVANGETDTLNGTLALNTMVKSGAGTLQLGGTGQYGALTVQEGTLSLASATALSTVGQTVLQSGAVLQTNNLTSDGRIVMAGGTLEAGTSKLSGSVYGATGTSELHNAANQTATLAGSLAVAKDATLRLTGGTFAISGATVNEEENGGTLVMAGTRLSLTDAGTTTINGTLQADGSAMADKSVSLYSNRANNNSTRNINHLDITSGTTLKVSEATWNTIWNIHELTGSGTLQWDSGTTHYYSSRLVLDGDNAFSGNLNFNRTRTATSERVYEAYAVLAHDGAAKNATVTVNGANESNIMSLAINTENAQMKGLNGNAYAAIYAGDAVTGNGNNNDSKVIFKQHPVSTREATITITGTGGTYSGNIYRGENGNGISLVMNGSGTQTIDGSVVDLQDVTVNNGTLRLLTDTVDVAGSITLARAATLYVGKNSVYSLTEGETLKIKSGATFGMARLAGTLKLGGGILSFDSNTLDKDVAALQSFYVTSDTDSLTVDFTNTSGLKTGVDYKLATTMVSTSKWSGLSGMTYTASGIGDYMNAAFSTTSGDLKVRFTMADGANLWHGTDSNHEWTNDHFADGTVTAVFNDSAANRDVVLASDRSMDSAIIDTDKGYTFTSAGGTATIGTLTLRSEGTAVLNENAVRVTGETHINAGTLVVRDAEALQGTTSGEGTLRMEVAAGSASMDNVGTLANLQLAGGATYTVSNGTAMNITDTLRVEKGAGAEFNTLGSQAAHLVSDGTVRATTLSYTTGKTAEFNGSTTLGSATVDHADAVVSFNGSTTISDSAATYDLIVNRGTVNINGELTVEGHVQLGNNSAGKAQSFINIGKEGVLKTALLNSSWGFNTLTVDGLVDTEHFNLSTGTTQQIMGSGVINATTLSGTNAGKYHFTGVRLNIGAGGIDGNKEILLRDATLGALDSWKADRALLLDGLVTVDTEKVNRDTLEHTGEGAELALNGVLSGNTATLVKEGKGTLKLSGTNSYGAGTLIREGSVVAANTAALGTGAVEVQAKGSLQLGTASVSAADVTLTGGRVELAAGTGAAGMTLESLTIRNDGSIGHGVQLSAQNGTGAISMAAAGAGDAHVQGALELVKDAEANQFSLTGDGSTTLNNTLLHLAAGTTLHLNDMVLGADSRITDDAAQVAVGNVVFELKSGMNVKLTENAAPVTLAATGAPATRSATLTMTNVEDVTLTGYHLMMDLSGISMETLRNYDIVGIAMGEGADAASYSEGLDVTATHGSNTATAFYQGEDYSTAYFLVRDLCTPEPATATLSLLALAALAARRRRK